MGLPKSFVSISLLFFSTLLILSPAFNAENSAQRTNEEVMAMYESWLVEYGKSYNLLGEKEMRFEIFKENLRFIDEHNANSNRSFTVGLNQFADLTDEEYRSTYVGFKSSSKPKMSDRYEPRVGEVLPDSIDWRETEAAESGSPWELLGFFGHCRGGRDQSDSDRRHDLAIGTRARGLAEDAYQQRL